MDDQAQSQEPATDTPSAPHVPGQPAAGQPLVSQPAAGPLALVVSLGADDYLQQLAERAEASLSQSGWRVEHLDLVASGYAPAMTEADRRAYHTEQSIVDPLVRRHADLVMAAKALVFVYPVVWGTMPALLKGWIDRTFVIGVALILVNGKVKRNLTGLNHVVGIAVSPGPGESASTRAARRADTRAFRDRGKRLITRTIPIITKRRAKKQYWHHTRSGGLDDEALDNGASKDADFAERIASDLRKLSLPKPLPPRNKDRR